MSQPEQMHKHALSYSWVASSPHDLGQAVLAVDSFLRPMNVLGAHLPTLPLGAGIDYVVTQESFLTPA